VRLQRRLLLHGVALPAALWVSTSALGGALLVHFLRLETDQRLASEAAVEAVSLFDLQTAPHLHLPHSSALAAVEGFANPRGVYGPDGERLIVHPEGAPVPERLVPSGTVGVPILADVVRGGEHLRELRLPIRAPDERLHMLVLVAPTAPIEAALGAWLRATGLATLLGLALLAFVQRRAARALGGRVENLIAHVRRVESGDLSSRPEPDATGDELAELRRALAEATAELEGARRAQDRLVADAAHELRTPLASIRANVDVTLRRPREPEDLCRALEEVREEVDRLAALSTELIELARTTQTTPRRRTIELASCVREAVEIQAAAAEARGSWIELDETRSGAVSVDPETLRRAIENLLSNAIKFTPRGRPVRVTAEVGGGRFSVRVHDEGAGIPPTEREAVFEPFHRVDARVPGAGLGLAIVRDIARLHGGRAFVADEGPGTTVVIEGPSELSS
jgi:signal transduction histidine kinase